MLIRTLVAAIIAAVWLLPGTLAAETALSANGIGGVTQSTSANHGQLITSGQLSTDSAGNVLVLRIEGDLNGALSRLESPQPPLLPGLTAGALVQKGNANNIDLTVLGDRNLFAMRQEGTGNQIHGEMRGFGNRAEVTQSGNGNFASFSQNGVGNSVTIMQSSW